MGSLVKVFCGKSAEILRRIRGNLQKVCFITSGKGVEILQKARGNLWEILCNDPFPNDPISEYSILLRRGSYSAKGRASAF